MPNLYETLLIVTPEADDVAVNAVIGDLRTTIEADGGSVLQAGVWERRKLAYQVKGKSEGIYVLIYADGNNTLPAVLKSRMKLDEAVIRSMVLRLEDLQETEARQRIEQADHSQDAAAVEAQRLAAERRREAEAAASAMSLDEMVAAQEAEAPAGVAAPESESAEDSEVDEDEAGAVDDEAGADAVDAAKASGDTNGGAAEATAAVDESEIEDEEEKGS